MGRSASCSSDPGPSFQGSQQFANDQRAQVNRRLGPFLWPVLGELTSVHLPSLRWSRSHRPDRHPVPSRHDRCRAAGIFAVLTPARPPRPPLCLVPRRSRKPPVPAFLLAWQYVDQQPVQPAISSQQHKLRHSVHASPNDGVLFKPRPQRLGRFQGQPKNQVAGLTGPLI